jgi:L-alanine-DL-glutamate epimerase-like enolase superfamily enzyme
MRLVKESEVLIEEVNVSAYKIPTKTTECDGTYCWTHTTLVLVEITAGGMTGIGYTYADTSTAVMIQSLLEGKILRQNIFDITSIWNKMIDSIRNLGRPGITSMAVAAVDVALWDLKAKLLDISLIQLLGAYKDKIPVYGSGGFTNYDKKQLTEQLGGWVEQGIKMVKIKVGTHPDEDINRAKLARKIIGDDVELFVDANGAYQKKQALQFAVDYAQLGVTWFEEPVSSDHIQDLAYLVAHSPPSINIATGEYGYDLIYFRRLLEGRAVDMLQADITRCAGISGFLQIAALAEAFNVPLSTHCAPHLHVHPICAFRGTIHIEYFYDHVRIEKMLFDGANDPEDGYLIPDYSRPGIGLEFKKKDAKEFQL